MSSAKLPEPEINVTPLVDVVLVLLIIFMVIAPNLQQGVAVEMPEAKKGEQQTPENAIEVVMTSDSTLYLEQEAMSREALFTELAAMRARGEDRPLLLKADQKLPYGDVRDVFRELQTAGFRNVGLKVAEKREGG